MLTQLKPQLQQRLGLSMPKIATFCQRWHITELSLFGSVLGDRFHSDRDINILIRPTPNTRQGLLTLAKIKHDPEASTGRVVDIALKDAMGDSEKLMELKSWCSAVGGDRQSRASPDLWVGEINRVSHNCLDRSGVNRINNG